MNIKEKQVLPVHWGSTTLGEITNVDRRKVNPAEKASLDFIGMEHVPPHSMRLLGRASGTSIISAAVHFFPGDVLYGRLRPYLNKVFAADFEGLCSAEFIPLTVTSALISEFLAYRLHSTDFVAFASSLNEGDRPRVDYQQISVFPVLVPPLPEQRRIVEAIETNFTKLDAAEATLKRIQSNLKRYRASVLKAAVEGTLVPTEAELARRENRDYEPAELLLQRILTERRRRWEEAELAKLKQSGKPPKNDAWKKKYQEPTPPDTSNLPPLPEGWCWTNMDSLTVDGPQNGLYVPQTKYGNGTPILRIDDYQIEWSRGSEELRQVEIDEDTADKYRLCVDDIVVNRVNSPSHLGKAVVIAERNLPSVFESNMMRLAITRAASPHFVHLVLSSVNGRQRLTENAKWAVNQASINQGDVLKTAIPLPPFIEQQRIVHEVDRLLSLAIGSESAIQAVGSKSVQLRRSILKLAFEGKLVPQDPNDEPASILLDRLKKERKAVNGVDRKQSRRRGRQRKVK